MTAKKDIISKDILTKVCDIIERQITKAEKTTEQSVLDECISEIDFDYYILKRYNSGCLPFSDDRFNKLDKRVEKIKKQ